MGNWIWWVAAAAALFFLMKPSVPATAILAAGELRDWIASKKDLQLIDVRSSGEYGQGHLSAAKLIPLDQLGSRLKELDARRPLVVYCASGNRSARALKLLLGQGFPEAKHLQGGISAWVGAGLPVTR
jgi:sulfur-carrier protein adenylyltransferase/sulfurtransferase